MHNKKISKEKSIRRAKTVTEIVISLVLIVIVSLATKEPSAEIVAEFEDVAR